MRVFPGIRFEQNGFQYRLIRRVDALVQLPQAGAEVFFSRDPGQAAEINPLITTDIATLVEVADIFVVALFHLRRHHEPQQAPASKPDRRAVKLVKQQQVLARTAVIAGHLLRKVMAEPIFINQEKVGFDTLGHRPVRDQGALALQRLADIRHHIGTDTDPDIEIAGHALSQGRGTAHRIKAQDRALSIRLLRGSDGSLAGQRAVIDELLLLG